MGGDNVAVSVGPGRDFGSGGAQSHGHGDPIENVDWKCLLDVGFTGFDSFSYTVTNGNRTNSGVANFRVGDSTPWGVVEAVDDQFLWTGGTLTGDVLINDWSRDNFDIVLATADSVPGLTLHADGTFDVAPTDDCAFLASSGTSFSYTATDSEGYMNQRTARGGM